MRVERGQVAAWTSAYPEDGFVLKTCDQYRFKNVLHNIVLEVVETLLKLIYDGKK